MTLRYDDLSRTHFWLTSKTYVIERFLDAQLARRAPVKRVLEVGCCAGQFLQRFVGRCAETHGLDLSQSALVRCHQRCPGIKVVRANGLQLPYADGAFDLVLMQDVLEHIPDDEATLAGLRRVLAPDGLLFICVPAYMALYGHHDKLFGHVRRYTRPQLVQRLRNNGFAVKRATYFQSPFLVPLYVKRRFGHQNGDDFIVPPAWLNAFLDRMLRLEAVPMRLMNLPFGPTLMCVAEPVCEPRQCTEAA